MSNLNLKNDSLSNEHGKIIDKKQSAEILGVHTSTVEVIGIMNALPGCETYYSAEMPCEFSLLTVLNTYYFRDDLSNHLLEEYRKNVGSTISEVYASHTNEYKYVKSIANVFYYLYKKSNYSNMWDLYNRMDGCYVNKKMMIAYLLFIELNDKSSLKIESDLWQCIVNHKDLAMSDDEFLF